MPSDRLLGDQFSENIAEALLALGLGPDTAVRVAVHSFVERDLETGATSRVLGLCEIVAIKLKAMGREDELLAQTGNHLRAAMTGFGEAGLPGKGADEGEPIGNAPRSMAEQLQQLLNASGINTAGHLDAIEAIFRREFGRGGWRRISELLGTLLRQLTERGEPEFDGLMTAAMRARDILAAIAAPRAGVAT